MEPFNVKTFKKRVVEAEDGLASIDWVVLLAALTGLGVALVEFTEQPLGTHAGTVRNELQDNSFETAWVENIPVGPSGEGMPDIVQTSGTGSGSTGGGSTGGGSTGGGSDPGDSTGGSIGGGGSTTGGPTTDPDPSPDPDPDPAPDPDPDPQPDPDPDPAPDPDPSPDPDPGGGSTGPTLPFVPAGNVQGCPDPDKYIAQPVAKTGEQIADNTVRVNNLTTGGATTSIVNCPGIVTGNTVAGYFYANPTYTLDLSGMNDDFWRFQVHTRSNCDTTLLVQDAAGNFHFDDDSGQNFNARVRLFEMADLNGRINIWIGSYSGSTCSDTDLRIRIWD